MRDADAATGGWAELESGRLAAARVAFWQQAERAEAAGDVTAWASAALGLGGIWVHEHRSALERARVADVQRRALAALEPGDPLAHRLRTRLAAEYAYAIGEPDGILRALDDARRRAVPLELAEALSLAHHCLLGPEHDTLRLALADELLAVSPATGRTLDGLVGLMWRTVDLFLAGDRRASRSLVELRTHLAASPCAALEYVVAAIDVMLAMRDGRLADAEAAAERCAELGTEVGDADALGWYGAQLIVIRWMQGRLDEIVEMLGELVSSPTVAESCQGFEAALAVVAAAAADTPTAATALGALRANGLAAIPSSSSWSVTMHAACEAAHALGDAVAAAELYELLVPYAERPVMGSLAVGCLGSAHRPLGLAALTMGDIERAIAHLEAAVELDTAFGNRPCVAIDRATLADALRQRDAAGDASRADELTALAIADATRFGMVNRAEAWAAARPDRRDRVTCRRDGRVWHVGVDREWAVVPHSVGMTYLAQLLAHPGAEIPALDLASGHRLARRQGGLQPVLDRTAKARYRRELQDLREELDDAEACADLGRASIARMTLDRYVEELAAATGLGGRDRSFPHDAERARVSVRKAIGRALAAISDANASLGRALAERVVTGTRCMYRAA